MHLGILIHQLQSHKCPLQNHHIIVSACEDRAAELLDFFLSACPAVRWEDKEDYTGIGQAHIRKSNRKQYGAKRRTRYEYCKKI